MKTSRFALALALLTAGLLAPALRAAEPADSATAPADPWAGWRFLAGSWNGTDNASHVSGTFSFEFELDDHVLVRRDHADLPATGSRPASKHDGLMVIDREPGGEKLATFYDNEGHVLRYTATLSADGRTLTFLTATLPSAPRFRLTYAKAGDDGLDIRFEIARPGAAEAFSTYLSGHARRAGAPPPK
jgi:hypothetical protein